MLSTDPIHPQENDYGGMPGDPDDCGLLYSPSYAIFKLRPERQVLQMHG
jgi:hypothetical protein